MCGKRIKKLMKNPLYIRAGIIAAAATACFIAVFLWDNLKEIDTDEAGRKILQRNGHGQGDSSAQLKVKVGEREEEISVNISEQAYAEEELEEVFQKASEILEKLILGENGSLEEVRADLDLISEITGTGISVSWELDN